MWKGDAGGAIYSIVNCVDEALALASKFEVFACWYAGYGGKSVLA